MAIPAKIDDQAKWYIEQKPTWDLSDTLLGGTPAMRKKGQTYLPKFELEGTVSYENRLGMTVLTNFYLDSLMTSLGLMFREDPTIEGSSIPEEELKNIDNLGHSINDFAYMMAYYLLTHGVHHVQVDMPVNEGAQTLGDDIRMGLRPYWVSIKAENLFNAFYTTKNNVRTITQTRVTGHRMVSRGLEVTCYDTIFMFNRDVDDAGHIVVGAPVTYETWIRKETQPYTKSDSAQDSGLLPLDRMDEIPIVTFQINDEKFMRSRPTLDDMAHKNVEHWQVSSDHRNIFSATCYPIQTQIGTDAMVTDLGPHAILHSPGAKSTPDEKRQDVEFNFIAPDSAVVEQGRNEKDQIIVEANSLMMKMQQRSGGDRTATGDTFDFAVYASPLQVVSKAVENGMNRCLRLHAKWKGMDPKAAGIFKMPKVPALSASEQVRVTEIGTARRAGDLSHEAYIDEMKQAGVFKTDIRYQREKTRLEAEQSAEMFRNQELMQSTGAFGQPSQSSPPNDNHNDGQNV